MLDRDSEIEFLIKICVRTCDMNSTLGSVVPLGLNMKVSVSSTNSSLLVNLSVELLKDNLGNGQCRPSEFFGSIVFPEKCSRFLSGANNSAFI